MTKILNDYAQIFPGTKLKVCKSNSKNKEERLLFLCFSETTKSRRCSTAAIAKNIAHIPNITLIGNALTCTKNKNEYLKC
jgi:hypothetical protein